MHQSRFEAEASPRWQHLERLLDELPGRRLSARQKAELEEMPALYPTQIGRASCRERV